MTDNALLANLIMDKFKTARAPARRRSTRRKATKKTSKKRRTRRWKMVRLPSGMKIQVAKKGFLQTPSGRYVQDTYANRMRYFPETMYEAGATDVPFDARRMAELDAEMAGDVE